jgi:hypothetical protein
MAHAGHIVTKIKRVIPNSAKVFVRCISSTHKKNRFIIFGGIAVLTLVFYTYAPKPSIVLALPKIDQTNNTKEIYVKGRVNPPAANVSVNGKEANTDGSGVFTVFITAPAGQSILTISASSLGKRSTFIQPLVRELSQEEILAKAKKEQEQEASVKQRVMGADTNIQNLIDQSEKGNFVQIVRVIQKNIKKEGTYQRIIGQVINSTTIPVYWVKVTAKFFDMSDQLVDTKEGFAVAKAEALAPNKTHDFITQATNKPFAYYKLTTDWQNAEKKSTNSAEFEGNVNPNATETATPSALQTHTTIQTMPLR